ncbi:hypothetical protein [Phenylobacterium sp.]|uniref:hypothetical protein n=1 Tax=Phenylobacterium sp. TaxID=1871053 RepID=UPI00301CBCDB
MRIATSEANLRTPAPKPPPRPPLRPPAASLRDAFERWLRPAVGFAHPRDVLKDPGLAPAEKRAVLASWASDASAVQDEPRLRWLLGTPEPVPLADVREALSRLDRLDS